METFAHPSAFDPSGKDLDAINRPTWSRRGTVRQYERLHGWTDPGEQAVIEAVADEARNQPILDIGVGAGRTAQFLLPISENYTGIDYTPEMVDAFRKLHPGVRCVQMDARDLASFADGQFAMAYFSFNGIDAVDNAGRRQVMREVRRVLRPGGLFVFSAHNNDGPLRGEQPQVHIPFTWNPVKLGWRSFKSLSALPRAWINHHRNRALNETHDGWSIMNAGAHDFGIVVMYTTLAETKRQLAEEGFTVEAVYDSTRGERVAEGADTSGVHWFHYVARKPALP